MAVWRQLDDQENLRIYSNYAIFEQGAAAPTIVPPMTEWGMIILMILAALGAMYRLRRQKKTG